MRKQLLLLFILLALSALLSACQGFIAQPETASGIIEPAVNMVRENEAVVPAAQAGEKYGLVSGPIDDGGFNQLAWEGLQRAADELGVEVQHVDAGPAGSNAEEGIAQLIDEGVSGIISVGFGLGAVTKAASLANPDVAFVSIDSPSQTANDLGILFDVDAPSFMAGYLAAGMSKTGTVCTFGGQQIPPVLAFMVGFDHGVKYYNSQNNASVELLGWQTDPSLSIGGTGLFAGIFTDPNIGGELAEDLVKKGCDIIFPVAGATGLGAAEGAQEEGWTVIGVDADQTQTEPDFAEVYLTSVVKQIDVVVFEAVKLIHEGTFEGGENFIGTLENDGVGLAPFHSYEDNVPQQLKDDLIEIEQGLINGSISTGWPIFGSSSVQRLTKEQLKNAAYPSDFANNGTAQLTDGSFEEEAAPGSASKNTVQLDDSMIAFGDLDADGINDAAVILISSGGGSGTFYDLVAVIDRNGQPHPVATAFLGDRIKINDLSIQNGQVMVDMNARGPNEAMADEPARQETRHYQIQVSLEQVSEPVASVEVIDYLPTEIPTETQAGSCFANAVGLGREDAYRCTVDNQIYDPCFVVVDDASSGDDEPTVVCGADPITGETGFVLELTEPLPEPDVGALEQPWLIELADGTICGLMTGTVPGVDDRVAPYGCQDGTYLFDDFQQDGKVWMAEQAVIGLNDSGYYIEESEIVSIRTVWR